MYANFIGDKTITTIANSIPKTIDVLEFMKNAVSLQVSGVGYTKKNSLKQMKNRLE